MERSLDYEVKRLFRLLGELMPFTVIRKFKLDGWKLLGEEIVPPYKWLGEGAVFTNEIALGPCGTCEVTYLRAWFGGESLVLVDGRPYGQINEFHRELNLSVFCDGKRHKIEVQVVPRGLFGSKADAVFRFSDIIVYDNELRKVVGFTKNVIDVIKENPDPHLSMALIELTDRFLSSLALPRDSELYLKAVADNPTIYEQLTSTWSHPDFPRYESVYSQDVKFEVLERFKVYKEEVHRLKQRFPKVGKAYVGGHAHIDYAWLWPMDETKKKVVRTFANAVRLCKMFPGFVYVQSSAQMYEDVKHSHPELFEEIRNLVREGRWEPVGGMWVESDCNIPGVESLIRQFYYGQKFFEREFGKISRVEWLPDVFGFSWVLPQVMRQAGIEYFVTTKLNWNEANKFPYDLCRWRGIDGSEVVYYSFDNPEEGYNGRISAKSLLGTYRNFRHKDLTDKFFFTFGYGDGGGGPTEEMCENYEHLNEIPGIPNLNYASLETFFEELGSEISWKDIPVWDGELYLELHRGTLTSQGEIKMMHHKAENELRNSEILNALFEGSRQDEVDELWKVLLRNEFHDILPGSSIREVYEDARRELRNVIDECVKIQESFFEPGNLITLFNPTSYDQPVVFKLKEKLRFEESLQCVRTYDGNYLYYLPGTRLPALSFLSLHVAETEEDEPGVRFESVELNEDYVMENELLRVVVFKDGGINVFSKIFNRWAFDGKGNILALYKDIPAYWENWDIDFRTMKFPIVLVPSRVELAEKNELREVVRAVYEFGGSKVEQYYILESWSDELLVETVIDWHHRRSLLKVLFPTTILSRLATYDLDGGYVRRPTCNNTNFEKARFEVPAHRWVDISQYDFGVCVLNNGKYGHKVNGSVMELTAVKAGVYPDFFADEGVQEFSYSIYIHGREDVKEFYKRAERLDKGLKIFYGKPRGVPLQVKVEPDNLRVLSLRKMAGSFFLRLLETTGSTVDKARIAISGTQIAQCYLTDILERRVGRLACNEGALEVEFRPFEIKTVELKK